MDDINPVLPILCFRTDNLINIAMLKHFKISYFHVLSYSDIWPIFLLVKCFYNGISGIPLATLYHIWYTCPKVHFKIYNKDCISLYTWIITTTLMLLIIYICTDVHSSHYFCALNNICNVYFTVYLNYNHHFDALKYRYLRCFLF